MNRRDVLRLSGSAAAATVPLLAAADAVAAEPKAPMKTDAPAYDLVIRRANIFDGHKALSGLYDVAINGGLIAAVSAAPLSGKKEINAAEGWVMPGLIDTHFHFYDVFAVKDPASMERFEEKEVPVRLGHFLQHGVTTVKSVGDPTGGILDVQARIAAGKLQGPRLLVTGCGITGIEGHPASTVFRSNPWARAQSTGEVGSVQQMRDLVHHLADRKVDAIKLLSEGACASCAPVQEKYIWKNAAFPTPVELLRLPTDMLRAGIEAGHERGLRVTVHTGQQVAAREAVEAGADGLEHGVTIEPITDRALIDMMIKRDVTYTPTLWIESRSHPKAMENVRTVAEAGVRIVLGSDTFCGPGMFGKNSLDEAELMVKAGMTPVQSLVAATSNAARQCARSDIGTVAQGKRADLILLAGDPTKDINNLRKLSMTILNGKIVVDKRVA